MSGIIAQNTLLSSGLIKSPAGGGAWNFIKKLTASDSGNLTFLNGSSSVTFDGTYKEYLFTYNNVHPATTSEVDFEFNLTTDGSNYNVTKTSTFFRAIHLESGTTALLVYYDGTDPDTLDLAQSAAGQDLAASLADHNDGSCNGIIHIFNPASTTFVKHFISRNQFMHDSSRSYDYHASGYANTTDAVTGIQFAMSTGNIATGDICMYGIST